jgi:tripartite-type tricarboxylate transporter receptor subunit TctC
MIRASTVGTRRSTGLRLLVWGLAALAASGLAVSALGASALGASALSTPAQAADAYFKDRQIRVIVGSAPGGGYDAYGRLLAQYMRQHVPGNPTFIVQNMPGAGSLVAANYIYNVAPKDGTFIGAVNAMLATDPLVYPDRVKFDPRQFRWLGSALREHHVGVAWNLARVKTLDDILKNELIVAGTGGATNFYPLFVDAILGAKIKMIPGYQGSKQGMLAMERGEVGGVVGISWASVKATNGSWLREEKIRPFVQFGLKKHPELPDVSWIYDYARNDDDRAAMNLAFGISEFGRPFIAPPGVPDAVVDILRDAFEDTMNDPEFRADAEKRQLDLEITRGAEIQSLIEKIYKTPPAVVERVKKIVQSAE